MDSHILAFYIGIFIVFFSHIYSLCTDNPLKITMNQHSYGNLIAVALIVYYFMYKDKK
jgi:hypothetical protein